MKLSLKVEDSRKGGQRNKHDSSESNLSQKNAVDVVDAFGGTGGLLIPNEVDKFCSCIIDLRPIKRFLLEKVTEDFPLKKILLAEPDQLPINLYMARLPVFLKLCESKGR
jgi:hypothetical protein